MKFTASRLSDGNKVFPAEIEIDDHGVTVRIPGIFGDQSTHLDFQNIGSVSISTPAVGYSSITFHASGSRIAAHGFTTMETRQIKQAIDAGRGTNGVGRNVRDKGRDQDREFEAWKMRRDREHEREMADKPAKLERRRLQHIQDAEDRDRSRNEPWTDKKNFTSYESISNLALPDEPEDIVKTADAIYSRALQEAQEAMTSWGDRSFLFWMLLLGTLSLAALLFDSVRSPLRSEVNLIEAAIRKLWDARRKLRNEQQVAYVKELHQELSVKLDKVNARNQQAYRNNTIILVGYNLVLFCFFWFAIR